MYHSSTQHLSPPFLPPQCDLCRSRRLPCCSHTALLAMATKMIHSSSFLPSDLLSILIPLFLPPSNDNNRNRHWRWTSWWGPSLRALRTSSSTPGSIVLVSIGLWLGCRDMSWALFHYCTLSLSLSFAFQYCPLSICKFCCPEM
jgi:hypothetical protein